jgi:hypothetical protein
VRALCDRPGVLLVFDEVRSGLGRTGAMFAADQDGVVPDALALAKALGGGLVPIGAVLCNDATWSGVFAFRHSSTFAGNALAATVGLMASTGAYLGEGSPRSSDATSCARCGAAALGGTSPTTSPPLKEAACAPGGHGEGVECDAPGETPHPPPAASTRRGVKGRACRTGTSRDLEQGAYIHGGIRGFRVLLWKRWYALGSNRRVTGTGAFEQGDERIGRSPASPGIVLRSREGDTL